MVSPLLIIHARLSFGSVNAHCTLHSTMHNAHKIRFAGVSQPRHRLLLRAFDAITHFKACRLHLFTPAGAAQRSLDHYLPWSLQLWYWLQSPSKDTDTIRILRKSFLRPSYLHQQNFCSLLCLYRLPGFSSQENPPTIHVSCEDLRSNSALVHAWTSHAIPVLPKQSCIA